MTMRTFGAAVIFSAMTHAAAAELVVQSFGAYAPQRISWEQNDRLIVSKTSQGDVRKWQASDGALVQALPFGEPMEAEMGISRDGRFLVKFADQGHAVVVDRTTGGEIWKSKKFPYSQLQFTNDNSVVLVGDYSKVALFDIRKDVELASWKAEGKEGCAVFHQISHGRIAVILSNRDVVMLDGRTLAPVGRVTGATKEDGRFYRSKISKNGDVIAIFAMDGVYAANFEQAQQGFVRVRPGMSTDAFAISADGEKIAIGNQSGIWVYSTGSGENLSRFPLVSRPVDMEWNGDGTELAVATSDEGFKIFDLTSGKVLRSFGKPVLYSIMDDGKTAAISVDGGMIALHEPPERLTLIQLADASSSSEIKNIGQSSFMAFDPENRLLIQSGRAFLKYSPSGERLGTIDPQIECFRIQLCGPDHVGYRDNSKISFYGWDGAETGRLPVQPMVFCQFSSDGKFALVGEPEQNKAISVRMAPDWKVVAGLPGDVTFSAFADLRAEPDGGKLTWVDGRNRLVSYEIPTKQFAVLRELPASNGAGYVSMQAGTDWFVCSPRGAFQSTYLVVSRSSGKTVYESKPWKTFQDEMDVVPVAVTPDQKHLWMCGPAGHPVLVDLESGEPKLRVHTWNDGGLLFESAEGRFYGNASGLGRIRSVDPEHREAVMAEELVKKAVDREGILKLLARTRVRP